MISKLQIADCGLRIADWRAGRRAPSAAADGRAPAGVAAGTRHTVLSGAGSPASSNPKAESRKPKSTAAIAIVLTVALAACSGCYDEKALLDQVRSAALRNRLDEVDLGTFRTTMPRDPATGALTEMEFHIFGTAPRYRVQSIKQQLESDGYRLRHETLLAVRSATPEELAEPDLTELRQRFEEVVNHILDDAPIKTIGFYDVRVTYQ